MFSLGQVVMTRNASEMLPHDVVWFALLRHASGDWGDVCDEDRQANDAALKDGSRLFSVYHAGETKFWIITEADRSATTVLLPEDY